jgi:hypothetical protein
MCLHYQRHQREVLKLQELLKERTGEIKRMSSSFNVMKKLNNSMKEQVGSAE